MMSSKIINLSDSAIKRELSGCVTELNDPRYPLRVRIHQNRTSASWFLVLCHNNKKTWKKIAAWPLVGFRQVVAELPLLLLKHRQQDLKTVNQFQTVEGVLAWFRDRSLKDKSLSAVRKSDIKCHMDKHLIPALGEFVINDIQKVDIDEVFIWPQQSEYQLSTVRARFSLLKRAFNQAKKLEVINHDPIGHYQFSDFIDKSIKPKDSKLRSMDLPRILQELDGADRPLRFLILLMLSFGLRLGETRQLKFRFFDIKGKQLIIPSDITKTGKELKLPLSKWFITEFNTYLCYLNKHCGYGGSFLFPAVRFRDCLDASEASKKIRVFSQGQWSAHDLRKVARSSWMDLGIDYLVCEMLLNHSLSKLDETYIHTHAWKQKQSAINAWHHQIQILKGDIKVTQKTKADRETIGRSNTNQGWLNPLIPSNPQSNPTHL